MIHLYGLSYRMPDYAQKSLASIIENASEPVSITFVDNKSENSSKIEDYAKAMVDAKLISRAVFFSENIRGRALFRTYRDFPPDDSEAFFMMTDLDLVVPDGLDWVAETREMMKEKVCSGYSLQKENYVPPNGGFLESGYLMGYWMLALNRAAFEKEFDLDCHYTDLATLNLMAKHGEIKRSPQRLYHLAWDLWKDDPQYFKEKQNGVQWDYNVPTEVKVYE